MPSIIATAAFAALTIIPAVSAHGYVSEVKAGGKTYAGSNPSWFYGTKEDTVGWYADNQDNGFVAPDAYGSADIICHKGATPGNQYVEVEAGSEIDLVWNTWPDSHHGPVINYLARCKGDCTKIDAEKKEKLNFFKIAEKGLESGSNPGTWASDDIVTGGFSSKVTIPSDLKGNFVLRHEIIALHSANNEGGAQNYPQCINIKVTGSGSAHPCKDGADCKVGTELYKSDDAGILFNLYTAFTSYEIPGPKLYSSLKKRVAMAFKA